MPAKRNLVTRGDDYRRTVRTGYRVGGVFCTVHAVFHARKPDGSPSPVRFGFIVSKAVSKRAVMRNLIRRRLKTIADRQIHAGLASCDIVIRALPASADAQFADIEREVLRSIDRVQRKHRGAHST